MKKQNSSQHPIDNLLKQTLKDDLPPEVENRLNIHLYRFREKTMEPKRLRLNAYESVKNFFTGSIPGWRLGPQLIKNAALVIALVVFVILVVTAGFVPITDTRNALAESYSALTTSLNVSEQLSRSNVMECTVEAVTGKGKGLKYSIKWTPGWTRVLVISPENIMVKSLEIKNDQVTITDHTDNTLRRLKGLERLYDPQFQPIIDFITPARLRELLQMKWKPGSYRQRGECDEGTFTVLNSREKAGMEIMVDMCTFLPLRVTTYRQIPSRSGEEEEIGMKIHFTWETLPYFPRLIEQKAQ